MPKKTDIKFVALVAVGVMIAGYAMYQFRDVELIDNARNGYGG
jgi:hypothetical protein|tara:strand:+ start:6248 stop:6376 length:129 start_codon:yes stop_codon:yes gene_type:complete